MIDRLWVRADGSSAMGLGHVMRTLAVAQVATEQRIPTTYVCAQEDGVAVNVLSVHPVDVVRLDQPEDLSWLTDVGRDDTILFDGYHFGPREFEAARAAGKRVASLADHGVGLFPVDVLIDPNHEDVSGYEVEDGTTLLAGPAFALVRKEFTDKRRERTGSNDRLLVMAGSSDARGIIPQILEVIGANSVFEETVVVAGPGHLQEEHDSGSIRWVRAPVDVAELFDSVDAAVSAAGSTTWELLCSGVPTALIQVADNQTRILRSVAERDAALVVGDASEIASKLVAAIDRIADPEIQRALSLRALETVDGRGPEKIFHTLGTQALT